MSDWSGSGEEDYGRRDGYGGGRGGRGGAAAATRRRPPLRLQSEGVEAQARLARGAEVGWKGEGVRGCRYGRGCPDENCEFPHPVGWDPKRAQLTSANRDCAQGIACYRPECPFKHPQGWSKGLAQRNADNRPCKFGTACTRSDCKFRH